MLMYLIMYWVLNSIITYKHHFYMDSKVNIIYRFSINKFLAFGWYNFGFSKTCILNILRKFCFCMCILNFPLIHNCTELSRMLDLKLQSKFSIYFFFPYQTWTEILRMFYFFYTHFLFTNISFPRLFYYFIFYSWIFYN